MHYIHNNCLRLDEISVKNYFTFYKFKTNYFSCGCTAKVDPMDEFCSLVNASVNRIAVPRYGWVRGYVASYSRLIEWDPVNLGINVYFWSSFSNWGQLSHYRIYPIKIWNNFKVIVARSQAAARKCVSTDS